MVWVFSKFRRFSKMNVNFIEWAETDELRIYAVSVMKFYVPEFRCDKSIKENLFCMTHVSVFCAPFLKVSSYLNLSLFSLSFNLFKLSLALISFCLFLLPVDENNNFD